MRRKHKWFLGACLCGILCISAFWQGLVASHYKITSEKIETPLKAALLTDLHSTFYGDNQEKLLEILKTEEVQAVFLSGDIADDQVPHDGTKALLSVIGETYPCYYVSGNHEYWSGEFEKIEEMFVSYGVRVLHGEGEYLKIGEETIWIAGVDDPDGFDSFSLWEEQLEKVKQQEAATEEGIYTILLSHRPELTAYYENSGFDMVLSGHAHGGQVRIPVLLPGLFAPNQGWFPDYTDGMYDLGETTMIVSRGLCRNNLPRIWNPPEVVFLEFDAE